MSKTVKRSDSNIEEVSSIKKFKNTIISEHVDSEEFHELFTKHWHNLKPLKTDRIEIITEPYRICKISNFLVDDNYINEIKDELKDVKSFRNNMDLYQFEQTEDLANVETKNITNLYKTFKCDVTNWMEKKTKIKLNGKISMSSATYSDTDYLLCHDDNMGDRRIAFVLYLSKNWTSQDGGALDIFDTDKNGQPNNVVRSLIPEYNSLVFFEVVDNSYHQVAEITSQDKFRLSINGWFHGPLRESNKQRRLERIFKYFEPEHNDIDLLSYVSKIYLYETIVENIQKTIEKDSFIYLPDFLIPETYEALSIDVKSERIKWDKTGPADLQNYEIADERSLPDTLKEFYNIFKSIHIFHLLKQYTELDLLPDTSEMKPKMKIELQRWSRGCYMLINDKKVTQSIDEGIEKSTEIIESGNRSDFNLKAERNMKKYDKVDENIVSGSSQNEKNDDEFEERDETVPSKLENQSSAEKNIDKDGKAELETKSVKGKGKISMSKAKAASSNCKNVLKKNEETVIVRRGIDSSSDIEDYLSELEGDSESDVSELDDDEVETDIKSGTLDVLLQFHTNNVNEDATIDYIDPSQKDGALIHIPPQDNHLCLVYRTADTCRCNKYVNHYCEDYFYTLVCSYYE